MNRIRILQIVSGLAIGDQLGGAERFAVDVACRLPREEFQTAVFAMWRFDSPAERYWLGRLEEADVAVFGLLPQSGRLVPDLLLVVQRLFRAIDTFRPHLTGSQSERADFLSALAKIAHPLHPRAVRTMQTERQWQRRPWLGTLLLHTLFPASFDIEIAVSESISKSLEARPVARILRKSSPVCYNGVDSEFLCDFQRAETIPSLPDALHQDLPRIGVIGRLAEQKGHSHLFRALKIVCTWRPVNLVVVGSGELEPTLRRLASELGLHDRIHFLGSRSDVCSLLPSLDLVVSSSLWEGFQISLLEAMAIGTPVIATDVSGSREIVRSGETGRLVPPANPSALAEAIITALSDPDGTRKMALAARLAASRFTVENAVACYAEIVRTLGIATRT